MASPHRIYGPDKIGDLTKQNSTTVQLAASTITLGGLQYDTASLQVLTSLTGVGGLDSGVVEADTKYNVYVVLDGSAAALIASKADSPAGFTVYNKVGFFVTNSSTAIKSLDASLKYSNIRIEDSTGRGVSPEALTMQYDNIVLNEGSGLSIDNSNGTIITVLRDGFISITANLRQSTASRLFVYITKNQINPDVVPLKSEIMRSNITGDNSATDLTGGLSYGGTVKVGDKFRIHLESGGTVNDSSASPNLFEATLITEE